MNDTNRLVRATAEIYVAALFESAKVLVRNVWIIGVVPAYTIGLQATFAFASGLGFAGGFLNFLATAACASLLLTLLEELVTYRRVRLEGLGQSFGRYFSRVITVFFIFWIVRLLLGMVISQNPELAWLTIAVNAGIFLVFNPIPEVIYQGQSEGMTILEDTLQFVRENLVEWFLPLALMLAPFFLIRTEIGFIIMANLGVSTSLNSLVMVGTHEFSLRQPAQQIVVTGLASLFLVWAMLFRGFLFRALARSGRRQRIFASRARDQ